MDLWDALNGVKGKIKSFVSGNSSCYKTINLITRVFLFFLIDSLVSLQKLCKSTVVFKELIVRADLCDLSICHHHYDITLREEPNTMSH